MPTHIKFSGDETTQIIPTAAHSGNACYWGNFGDSIDAKLTRAFDLTDIESATLNFMAWYELEELWDFAYVMVSTDDGSTWTLLEGLNTTDENPNGTGLGPGFSGASDGWMDQSFDISAYAGGEILVRFEHVTDDAVNIHGICIDDIEIPEIEYFDDAEGVSDWEFDGFAHIDPTVPQKWLLSIVREPADGAVVEHGGGQPVIHCTIGNATHARFRDFVSPIWGTKRGRRPWVGDALLVPLWRKTTASTAMPWRCVFESPQSTGGRQDPGLCDPSALFRSVSSGRRLYTRPSSFFRHPRGCLSAHRKVTSTARAWQRQSA